MSKFNTAADSSSDAPDVVIDFSTGIDKIDISALHTSAGDSFQIVTQNGNTFIDINPGGDGSVDVVIEALRAGVAKASDVILGGGRAQRQSRRRSPRPIRARTAL